MSTIKHLSNAPITEALIDIRVRFPKKIEIENIADVIKAVTGDYPNCRKRRSFAGQISFSESSPPTLDVQQEGPDGFLMTSNDGTQIFQARLDGFTFSRLRPYETWGKLRDESKKLWNIYCDTLHPTSVTRLAVRYINRIDLPPPIDDLKEWILTGPEIAPGLPQQLAGYFFKAHLPFKQPLGFVNITQKVGVNEKERPDDISDKIPLIFDIDAFLHMDTDPSSNEIWDRLEDLRTIKNNVFFESITSKTEALFI